MFSERDEFGSVSWNKDDVINAMEINDIEITEETVEKAINKCLENEEMLKERMIDAGWELIYDIISKE